MNHCFFLCYVMYIYVGVPDFIDKVHWAALMRQSNSNKDNLINSISVS